MAGFLKWRESPVCFHPWALCTLVPWVGSLVWRHSKWQKIGSFLIIDSLCSWEERSSVEDLVELLVGHLSQLLRVQGTWQTEAICLDSDVKGLVSLPWHASTFCVHQESLLSDQAHHGVVHVGTLAHQGCPWPLIPLVSHRSSEGACMCVCVLLKQLKKR